MEPLHTLVTTALLLLAAARATAAEPPHHLRRAQDLTVPVIAADFPDPSVTRDADGTWYAFATSHDNKNIQVARATELRGEWTLLGIDPLPRAGSWAEDGNSWAPDVRRVPSGKYVMYYSGQTKVDPSRHCVGAAIADTITGPYIPRDEPLNCELARGGSIDPAGFEDANGRQYVVYKIDGNSIGHGGSCLNTVPPIVPTPIQLQEVEQDGVTKIGDPVTILDRDDADGPLVEAPDLVLDEEEGLYILLYSAGCYLEPSYSVNYATATNVTGPFEKAQRRLFRTGDRGFQAPGGANGVRSEDGVTLVFHAGCPEGRCMFIAGTVASGRELWVE
ncbi:glycoside hydrolase family 43 protein [Durotheca rogersii]|uniref:glycoside hydrolase family 43 protein n=1 Tax=Durotheca rogersii TaxID=419775 RepID=UPI0022204F9E|nr:glycoside hydrolase family 43 protein [Durotheca rogersii]KAI5865641.1 glycoside hydrolase family 43 protein [Durotheca rogersii]